MTEGVAIQVDNLYIARSEHFCVNIPSMRLLPGTMTCIAGPNGSGKTTLTECLCGVLAPTKGSVTLCGIPLSRALKPTKSLLGYIPDDEDWFIKELSAQEYFEVLMSVYWSAGVTINMAARCSALAHNLRFTAFDQPLQELSHGNKKKVQIIAALMHDPKVLVIDEIRNGLDPLAVIAAEELLHRCVQQGTCIVAATHDLWWAERMAQDIIILVNGKPLVQQSVPSLLDQYGHLENAFIQLVGR